MQTATVSEPLRTPALMAENVSKAFASGQQRTQVLDGLSLSLEAGELTLISGPSGCGKSTLLAILSGLQKVDSGRVQPYKDAFFPGPNSARLNSAGLGVHWSGPNSWLISASIANPVGNTPELLGENASTHAHFWVEIRKGFY